VVVTRPRAVVDEAVQAQRGEAWRTLPAEVVGVDVDRLITDRTHADVVDRRDRLIEFLWKGSGLPTCSPEIEPAGAMADLDPLEHGRIERATLRMRNGLTATSYLVHPHHPVPGRFGCFLAGHGNGRAPRYHQPQLAVMRTMLEHGYLVAAVDMPLQGWNSPDIDPPDDGGVPPADPRSHELFSRYERADFSAATYFLDPVVALVNHASASAPLTDVVTFGFSGGAWTTVLHAAVDPRVTRSIQVAGTWPFFLRPHPAHHPNFGDWEQRRESLPGLYDIAGYLDLYVLGSVGAGRRQLQVLNRFDPSCFPGVGSRSYAQPVRDAAAALDGEWDVVEDPSHGEHQVSPYAVALLAHELERLRTDDHHSQEEQP
jgi:pimeloyl-ACP methyl ester carboxylesterase